MIRWCIAAVALLVAIAVAPAEDADLQYWAMEAHTEGRDEPHFDKGLEPVRGAVKGLKHDTYTKIKTGTHPFKGDEPFSEKLDGEYCLKTTAPQKADGGRYRMTVRITMVKKGDGEKEIEALETELLLQPGKKVLVRGLKLEDDRELLIVFSLAPPKDDKKS